MQTLLGTPPAIRTTYAEAFKRHVGICPHRGPIDELASLTAIDRAAGHDELLNFLLAERVERHLGAERPVIIYHYRATQASLAKVVMSDLGYQVAERFELYWRGVELANGFHELTDADELRRRLSDVNSLRAAAGRAVLPLPESLLSAMEHGLPDCTGCALGFDRLAMLAVGTTFIHEVMPFAFGREI
jgi:lysyl-tRNA synthetase class 2